MLSTLQHSTIYSLAETGAINELKTYLAQHSEPGDDLASLALIGAAEANQLDTASMLLGLGAQIEGPRQRPWIRPLWKAAKHGHLDMVKLLVGRGADPNSEDDRGMTALDYAQRYSRGNVVAFLLEISM